MTKTLAIGLGRVRIRKTLMMSCASAALAAAALTPQSAHAQALGAFRGSITGTTGSVTRSPLTNTTETITIGSNNATINWSPDNQQAGGGPLDFLPSGNTATFTSSAGVTDYTVLNRIIPDSGQPIALNGHVVSTLQGTSATGGKIWFYSPGGIVIGASAVFDVGGLLLTANDVTSFATNSDAFSANFSAPASSTSKIQVMNGAQINALQQNSYIALVAPRIEQGGNVRVNGSAVYAAGEQLTLTMNQGLFDIRVEAGTTDSNGIVHTGVTGGPAKTDASDNHKIYMVAVPKNQALTMLLGGTVGFDDASSASVQNGSIFLSSGWGVKDSDASGQYFTDSAGADSGIAFGPGSFKSDVTVFGQGDLAAVADTGDIHFGGRLEFDSFTETGAGNVSLIASNGYQISIAHDLNLVSSSADGSYGSASVIANTGGSISIGGSANLSSRNGTNGGNSSFTADNGSITVGGTAHLSAAGESSNAASGDAWGQDGYGGNVSIAASNGGSITTGDLLLDAYGVGQSTTGTGGVGNGYGGSIYVDADTGGALHVNGTLTADAGGRGGTAPGQAGNGEGGNIGLSVYGGAVAVGGDMKLYANGFGGDGQTAGAGYGGSANASVSADELGNGASLNVTGDLTMQAAGQGGVGADNLAGTGGQGGDGYGGNAWFYVDNYSAPDAAVTLSFGTAEVFANGTGGNGGNGITGGNGGSGYAYGYGSGECGECGFFGSAEFNLYGGTMTADSLLVYSTARGGNGGSGSSDAGGTGGDAIGGYSSITVGGNLTTGKVLSYDRAFAGNGGSGTTQGNGGQAEGGYALVDVSEGGQLTGSVDIAATASGGSGNTGGEADGGSSWLNVEGILTGGTIALDSSATGGAGIVQGGIARAGSVEFDVNGGSASTTSASLHSDAVGGNAANGAGGFAFANSATVESNSGGSLTGGDLSATANATGGNGTTYAGGAEGGDVSLLAYGWGAEEPTSIALGNVTLTANGSFGTGATDGIINGGFGTVDVEANGAAISATSLTAQANGSSFGGLVDLFADADYESGLAGSLSFGSVDASANGGDWAGSVVVSTASGSSVNLGNAHLTSSGPFNGYIGLLAGECSCGGDAAALGIHTAALPPGGGISATDLTLDSTGIIYTILSGGADVSVSGALAGTAGYSVNLFDDGTGGAIRGHSIDFTALTIDSNAHLVGGTVNLTTSGYMNIGDVTASTSATFTAGSLASFTGTVDAPKITVTSNDIDVLDGASLGVWGHTNLLTLNAVSDGQPIIIGDGPEAGEGQYVLNEDGDLEAASLVINALGGGEGGAPDVQVYDLHVEGEATPGGGTRGVTLNTDGSLFVNGLVDFTGVGATDSLTINAGRAIEVNTDTGGIRITDGSGKLSGVLALNADNVWIVSQSLLSQLEQDPNFAGRDEALGSNSGTATPDGFVRAGTVTAGVSGSFLVQNSGTPQLFAGIDTGDGGLSIESTGSSPATVIAYGRKTQSNGTVLTNDDFFGSVKVSGAGGFTEGSAVNGCKIGAVSCGQQPTYTIDMATILGPIGEATDKDKDKDKDESDDGNSDPAMRLINTVPLTLDKQIDDPVTSGGDIISGQTN